ncbi:hypothetical protein Zmor_011894 [Zophobas morio]|uniref:Uncharacterized protein n=1 Tax=Zophobas morio TaxID=2755281 RepID=A0AA38HPG6_9CUCU|nr:hypothetical protein Zmor_011894 [Zophobas morio]
MQSHLKYKQRWLRKDFLSFLPSRLMYANPFDNSYTWVALHADDDLRAVKVACPTLPASTELSTHTYRLFLLTRRRAKLFLITNKRISKALPLIYFGTLIS